MRLLLSTTAVQNCNKRVSLHLVKRKGQYEDGIVVQGKLSVISDIRGPPYKEGKHHTHYHAGEVGLEEDTKGSRARSRMTERGMCVCI